MTVDSPGIALKGQAGPYMVLMKVCRQSSLCQCFLYVQSCVASADCNSAQCNLGYHSALTCAREEGMTAAGTASILSVAAMGEGALEGPAKEMWPESRAASGASVPLCSGVCTTMGTYTATDANLETVQQHPKVRTASPGVEASWAVAKSAESLPAVSITSACHSSVHNERLPASLLSLLPFNQSPVARRKTRLKTFHTFGHHPFYNWV